MAPKRTRVDDLLVARGLFDSTDSARRACFAGEVVSNDAHITAPSQMVSPDIDLRVKGGSRFVSRGGYKLQSALDAFVFDVTGMNCIDAGCSTGGFTDCLLQAGAGHVSAVDVGYGDFSMKLRNDSRVSLFERTNIKSAKAFEVDGPFDLLVADLSFIGLQGLLDTFRSLLIDSGWILVLVKPQFESDRESVGEGGVVWESSAHVKVLEDLLKALPEHGFGAQGLSYSALRGPAGNIEFFILGRLGAESDSIDVEKVVTEAHRELGVC